jgi:integrase/recombinase XerD
MDQIAPINRSIILTSKESLTENEHDDLPSEFLPSVILSEVYKDKSGKTIYPEIPKETKALHWALNRLANWDLPGKEHVGEYIRSMHRRHFRPRTYGSSLIAIYDFLRGVRASGKTRLEDVTKQDIEAFIEHEQDRGMKLSTVRTKLHCVNAFLGYAMDAGVISAGVLARRIRLRKPETLPRAMDPDDVKCLLSVIDSTRDRAMIMILLRTGMRIGELLNTRMPDIHIKDRRIDIYEGEKNRLGRVVYLSDDAMSALRAWLKIREAKKEVLFYAQGRKTMSYSTAHHIFENYLRKAGLLHKGYSLHVLRHTFASELLNAGMRIECLQPLMGHSSLEVTRHYARLTDKTREEEYFRAMTIIEGGGRDVHYGCDHQIQALLEEKKRFAEYS